MILYSLEKWSIDLCIYIFNLSFCSNNWDKKKSSYIVIFNIWLDKKTFRQIALVVRQTGTGHLVEFVVVPCDGPFIFLTVHPVKTLSSDLPFQNVVQ